MKSGTRFRPQVQDVSISRKWAGRLKCLPARKLIDFQDPLPWLESVDELHPCRDALAVIAGAKLGQDLSDNSQPTVEETRRNHRSGGKGGLKTWLEMLI